MLRNYLITALRNLRANKLYSFINIGGLSVGLAACLLIVLFVRDELSYDTWLPNAERIGRVEVTFRVPGREPMEFVGTPGPTGPALEKDFSSDIEHAVRLFTTSAPVRTADRQFSEDITYADPEFFEVFDLPMVAGERSTAMTDNKSMIISEKTATKYFGDGSALGQVLTVDGEIDYRVVGVFADIPRNSHFELEMLALFDTARYTKQPWIAERWTSANVFTYALFSSPEAMAKVESEMTAFVDRNVVLEIPGFDKAKISELMTLDVMPLLDIHLHQKRAGGFKAPGDINTVYTFAAIAALILLIACINFINLATARSMKRAREVAMRKVVGATRGQLVAQFLGEALLTALFALIVALALVELALGPFNGFVDKQLSLELLGDPGLAALALGLVAIVGVLGGTYPALYLSRFRPARVLKANQSSASGSTPLRNTLVVFQFAVSVGLIICTAVVYGQMSYARNLDLGYQKLDRVVLKGLGDMPEVESQMTLKREIAALPSVKGVALSSDTPPLHSNNNTLLYRTPVISDDKLIIENVRVDADFLAVYGIEPLAGRLFSPDIKTDARDVPEDGKREGTQSVVVNRTFVDKLGLRTPDEAVGVTLWETGETAEAPMVRTTIIGVIPDLHLRSIRDVVTPMLFTLRKLEEKDFNSITIHVERGQMKDTVEAVSGIWSRLVPTVPIRTKYVDAELAAQYDAIEKRGHIFGAFALFAVLIACLGLFGLATFAAERRTVEIGVRKALGATVVDIVRLLMWQFSKPVLIANLIAWPVAFYTMSRWLESFKYRIELLDPLILIGLFGGAALVSLVIAWGTVAGQAARVARASPIHALRCE